MESVRKICLSFKFVFVPFAFFASFNAFMYAYVLFVNCISLLVSARYILSSMIPTIKLCDRTNLYIKQNALHQTQRAMQKYSTEISVKREKKNC